MIGRNINNYEIRSLIGQGGMGTVWLAEHPLIGRKAAIKVLKQSYVDDEAIIARFMNEARAANAIRHPNIIEIIDVGRLPDGPPYLMMELLEGETLAERLERVNRLPLEDALKIVDEAGQALAAAHDKGIVHRDLKPENLLLVPDPTGRRGERVKLLDFGIAKLRTEPEPDSVRTGQMIYGTPSHMSPEQCRGLAEVDHRTDIYALGTMLYQMLCGAPPFVADSHVDVFVMNLRDAPRPPRSVDPTIPAHVEAAILRALAKAPEGRFASMAGLLAALRRRPAPGDGLRARAVRAAAGRKRWLVGTAAAVAAVGALSWPMVKRLQGPRSGPVTSSPDRVAGPPPVARPARLDPWAGEGGGWRRGLSPATIAAPLPQPAPARKPARPPSRPRWIEKW